MKEWTETDSARVGKSLATFLRKRKTGSVALEAWKNNYVQLQILYEEVKVRE